MATHMKVAVTRRGKPVAEVTPPRAGPPDLWGAMRGSARVPPEVDLTHPVVTARRLSAPLVARDSKLTKYGGSATSTS